MNDVCYLLVENSAQKLDIINSTIILSHAQKDTTK